MSSMDDLGAAINAGRVSFAGALDEMMSAHIRLFGVPGTPKALYELEERITNRLIEVSDNAEIVTSARGGNEIER